MKKIRFEHTKNFEKEANRLFTPSEYFELRAYLAANPESGDVIPDCNGCRKLRWACRGEGARGGARVIYFHITSEGKIVLLVLYVKSEMENITKKELKRIMKKEKLI